MSNESTSQATHLLRDWAEKEIRRLALAARLPAESATVTCEWVSTGQGWPQTAGEYHDPVEPSVVPQHYELTIMLPRRAQHLAEQLADELRRAADEDQTLGERVTDAEVPLGNHEPADADGEDALRIVVPFTVYVGR